jgi:hypothetical protein
MARFLIYSIRSFLSDWNLLFSSFGEKFYPFFQYKRNTPGSGVPFYENKYFIIEVLQALIIIPIFIVALLIWNIARVIPIREKFSNEFPDKIFDLAMGKDRSDYFSDPVSGQVFETVFIEKLKELTNEKEITDIIDFMKSRNINDLYGEINEISRYRIQKSFGGLVDRLTRVPSAAFMSKVKYCFSWLYDDESTDSKVHTVIQNRSSYINLGGHLWLYFFRHLNRSYFPWEEVGLIQKGEMNKLFQKDGTIEDFIDEDGALDSLSMFWERSDFAMKSLQKNIDNNYKSFFQRATHNDFDVVRKFALIWYIAESLRNNNIDKATYYYNENDEHHKRVFGCPKNKSNQEVRAPILSIFSKPQPNKTTSNDVTLRTHIRNISSNIKKARTETPSWLDQKYFFTGEKISKEEYLANYEVNDSDVANLPPFLYAIKHKENYEGILQTTEIPFWYSIICLIRIPIAVFITAIQAIFMSLQLIICVFISIIPFVNLYVLQPLMTQTGKVAVSLSCLLLSSLLLIDIVTNQIPIIGYQLGNIITGISSLGWSGSAALAICNASVIILFLQSLMACIYLFKEICINNSSFKMSDRESLVRMKINFYVATILNVLFLGSVMAFTYPGLILPSTTIVSIIGAISNIGVSCGVVLMLTLSSYALSDLVNNNNAISIKGFNQSSRPHHFQPNSGAVSIRIRSIPTSPYRQPGASL